VNKIALLIPFFALAACGQEPAPEPAPTQAAAAPEPVQTLPAPDQALFGKVFAETCEGAEPVSEAVCRRAMGSEEVACEFGLGEDKYLRHDATLAANEDNTGWELKDAEALCAEHGAHHVDN
jgi:hypothetical protein